MLPLPALPPRLPLLAAKPAKLPFALPAKPLFEYIVKLDGKEVGRINCPDVRTAVREANKRWNPDHRVALSLVKTL